jgi:hypothetical protein
VRSTDELVDRIVSSSMIPARRCRQEIRRELCAHIEDFVAAARDAGHEQHEIEKLLLASFGDPEQIARGFAWVYRYQRRRLRALTFTLSTVLLASCLLALALATQAGLAFGFGRPVMQVLASPHMALEALDIVASVAAYLAVAQLENIFASHRFQKAALTLTVILATLVAMCAVARLHMAFPLFGFATGIFFRAVKLFITPTLARVGIVVVCFPLIGLGLALLRAPLSLAALTSMYASWLILGMGYQLMTHLAARVDAALMSGLERIQAGYG